MAIVGAILILAGSVLLGAGIVSTTAYAAWGFVLGGIVSVLGIGVLIAGPLKRGWDAIPVNDQTPSDNDIR